MRLNARPAAVRRDVLYTVDHANRTLPYVRRIAEDLVRDYARWRECVRAFEAATGGRTTRPDAAAQALQREARHLSEDIKRALDELGVLGLECKALEEGLVDFPAVIDGSPAYLCWRVGEDEVAWWHRRGAGVAGRRPIDGVTVLDPADASSTTVSAATATRPPAPPARAGEAS